MFKIILNAPHPITPFNEPARDLRIQNQPLWLHHKNVLGPYTTREVELKPGQRLPQQRDEMLVYRDNLFFDEEYINAFVTRARKRRCACRAAFSADDRSFKEHALPLSTSYTIAGDLYLADLWYYPNGPVADAEPLVIDLEAHEMGHYQVPPYMADPKGELVFQVPLRALIAIDSWVHIFIADAVYGQFSRGERFQKRANDDVGFRLRVLAKSLYEGRQLLECSELVKIGRDCTIDPRAIIKGPAIIGNKVFVGPGAVIDNCIIGDNVTISQGCELMLSVVGDGSFMSFDSKLFMSTLMDNSIVAQNACLQMCVIGRNTFIGAGTTFTDYNLIPLPIKALDGKGQLKIANRPVLGGCVGHNCRIGAGVIVYPARTIESDVILVATEEHRVIDRDVRYEDSDHHKMKAASLHRRLYPRPGESQLESW